MVIRTLPIHKLVTFCPGVDTCGCWTGTFGLIKVAAVCVGGGTLYADC